MLSYLADVFFTGRNKQSYHPQAVKQLLSAGFLAAFGRNNYLRSINDKQETKSWEE